MPITFAQNFEPDRFSAETRPALLVRSGLLDQPKRPLMPDSEEDRAVYDLAHHAWRHQDSWSRDEHRSFWVGALRLWPRPTGPCSQRDDLALAAGWLRCFSVAEESIAALLGLKPETMRRYGTLRRADELRANSDQAGPPLPRIYAEGEPEPAFSTVNLPRDAGQPLAAAGANLIEAIRRRSPAIDLMADVALPAPSEAARLQNRDRAHPG